MNPIKYLTLTKNKYNSIPIGARASIAFIFASLLTQGLGIITMPIFTRILDTSDMGAVVIYNSWEVILGTVVGLALSSGSFNIAMMEFKDERDEYISSVLVLSTLSSVFMFGIFICFSEQIIGIFNMPKDLFYLMFVGFILMPATNFWMMKNRYEYSYVKVVIVTIISAILSTFFAIFVVIYFKNNVQQNFSLGYVRLYAAKLIPFLISTIIYISLLIKGKFVFKKKHIKFALIYSLPLLLHALSKQVLDMSDRIMISYFEGESSVGIYGLLYNISSISLIIWNAINTSLIPFTFKELEEYHNDENGNTEENLVKIQGVSKSLITVYFCFSIFIMLISPEVVRILATKEYFEAIYLMPPIAAGIFFTSFYNTFSNVLLFYKKTKAIMISTIIAAVVNIVLNYIFIPKFGFVAAAYTTLVSFIILAGMQFGFMKKVSKGIKIFDDKYLWSLAILMIVLAVFINILYGYIILRYLVITLILIMILLKRDTIRISLTKALKGVK